MRRLGAILLVIGIALALSWPAWADDAIKATDPDTQYKPVNQQIIHVPLEVCRDTFLNKEVLFATSSNLAVTPPEVVVDDDTQFIGLIYWKASNEQRGAMRIECYNGKANRMWFIEVQKGASI